LLMGLGVVIQSPVSLSLLNCLRWEESV
jgi:hypothetical protein